MAIKLNDGRYLAGFLVLAVVCLVSSDRLRELDENATSVRLPLRRHRIDTASATEAVRVEPPTTKAVTDKERVDSFFKEFTASRDTALNTEDLSALIRGISRLFWVSKSNVTLENGSVHQMNLKLSCVNLKLKELNEFVAKMFQTGSSQDDEVMIRSEKFGFLNELIDNYLDMCFTSLHQAGLGHNDLKGKMSILDASERLAVSVPVSKDFVINKKNWIYAFLAGTFIGLIGLLCYTIMPMLNLFYFGFFLQFLVAMAVGSLIGDALLHLIPQAFSGNDLSCSPMGHHSSEQQHSPGGSMKAGGHHMDQSAVLKGAGAIIGIYFFFLVEKFMRLHRTRCEKKQLKSSITANSSSSSNGNSKTKQHTTADENGNRLESYSMYEESAFANNKTSGASKDKYVSTELNRIKFEEDSDNASSSISINNETKSQVNLNLLDDSLPLLPLSHEEHNETSTSRVQSKKGKGHLAGKKDTFKHCHERHYDSKDFENVKLVAWMVIMGDGLHNFTDGLAIGASFANSMTAGIGTSIAVLFHELPHEIGDFAVLRRSGVTLRRAILFNAFSGILCLVGVGVGLFIGTVEVFSKWSLLFTAGVFLYIALVDMIPELSEDKETFLNILIQAVGIFVGVGIMLVIALFQDKIINLLQ